MRSSSDTRTVVRGAALVGAGAGAFALGAVAMGAAAIGAVAIGAMAVRRLAIRSVAIDRTVLRSVRIGDLSVARLHAHDIESGSTKPDSGLILTASPFNVTDTIARVTRTLDGRGVRLFAQIDHSGEAARVGLTMRPTQVLIFGTPSSGTPIMLAAPTAALDLPLKLLVSEDESGRTWLAYNSPAYLKQRHGVPAALLSTIDVVDQLVAAALAAPDHA